jgi:hypothetical protein
MDWSISNGLQFLLLAHLNKTRWLYQAAAMEPNDEKCFGLNTA